MELEPAGPGLLRRSRPRWDRIVSNKGETMKITRHGSSRFMGYASIDLKKSTIAWDAKDGLIHLKSYNIRDFTAEAAHNYDVTLTLDELRQMLSAALQAVPQPTPDGD